MALQTQQFNLPSVSFEGAGKLYEALAQNATAKGQVAGQDAATALGESNRGFSQFQQYFNQANATRAQARGEVSSANQMMTRSNQMMTNRAISTMNYNANQYKTVLQSVNALIRVGEHMKAADTKAQTIKGMIDSKRQADELKTLAQNDPYASKQAVEEFLNQYSEDPENPYLKGMAVYMFPTYDTVSTMARKKTFDTNLTTYATLVGEAKFANNNKVPKKVRNEYAKQHDMPVAALRDVEYKTFGTIAAKQVTDAQTPTEVNQILTKWDDDVKKNYDNEFFIKSRSAGTNRLITETNSIINKAVNQKAKEFKKQGENMWVNIINKPLDAKGEDIKTSLSYMAPNPVHQNSLMKEFETKYKQAAIDKQFTDGFTPSTMMGSDFWHRVSPEVKSKAETDIGKVAIASFMGNTPGDLNRFTKIMKAQSGHVKKAGEQLYQLFNFGSAAEKQVVYNKLNSFMMSSDLSPYLSQMMGDDELSRIILAGTIVQAKGGITEDQIAKNWEGALALVSQPTVDQRKLTPSSDQDLYQNVQDAAGQLGQVHGRFVNVMNKIYSRDPEAANNLVDKVFEYFDNLKETETYKSKDTGLTYNLQEYTTHSPDPFANEQTGIDEKYRGEIKARFLDNLRFQFRRQGKDEDIGAITYLPDNMVLVTNTWGYPISTVPLGTFIEDEKAALLVRLNAEAGFFEQWGETLQGMMGDTGRGIQDFVNDSDVRQSVLDDLANMIGDK